MLLNKKVLLSVVLAALLGLSASAAFQRVNTYADSLFSDVPTDEWYADEIKNTYELGLMNGVGGSLFDPEGNVTVGEAVTMAARAYALHANETIPESDGEWYQKYVNYAVSKGFLTERQFDDFDRPAARKEVATLFESAMPDGYFTAQNEVGSIPDVSESKPYHDALLTLYRAGVVMGSDSYGNFYPENNITRAEAAAVINRVALPENRLSKTLDKISDDDAYRLNLTSNFGVSGGKNGTPSGWSVDNRGGVPSTDYKINLSLLKDQSEEEEVTLTRLFNKITTGKLQIETKFELHTAEGFYIALNNEDGNPIYRLEVKDGAWQYSGTDGNMTNLGQASDAQYVLRAEIDLDNARSTTSLICDGRTFSHTGALILNGEDANVCALRYGSTEKGMASFQVLSSYTYVNYALYDDFKYIADGESAYRWQHDGSFVSDGELHVPASGRAVRNFDKVSGTVIAETTVFLNRDTHLALSLFDGTSEVVSLKTDGKNIVVNGESVYEYYDGLWYDFRFETDTDAMEVLFKLNGRKIATVPFVGNATGVDSLSVSNDGNGELKLDEFRVFRKVKHDDYVPEPVKPVGEEKYNVGINVCSLWTEGLQYGWETITPYDEPYMGYYDEGNPETADWEIKYMVEHGIDFQAFCWFSFGNDYIKGQVHDTHLHEGYKNAEYSDYMSYALLLEFANSQKPTSLEAWEKYNVPYIVEHYLKDERYMRIDNKAVVCMFGLSHFANTYGALGSLENVKAALDMLEEAAKEIGYDGILYMSCSSGLSKTEEASVGVDASYNYHFGSSGSSARTNITANEYQAKDTATFTVPTVSVGFRSIGWLDERYPLMTMEDYRKVNNWIRDEFLPQYAEEAESYKHNTVMISTWNEFGEGTYINPCKDNGGFGYLDILRETYTDEKADEALNAVPTDAQKRRINRMYPSEHAALMRQGYVSKTSEKEVLFTVDATDENSGVRSNLKEAEFTAEGFRGIGANNDPRYTLEVFGNKINTSKVSSVRVTLKVPQNSVVELYFKTSEDNTYNQNKWLTATATEEGFNTLTFDVSKHASWTGLLTGLYVDPIQSEGEGKECILQKVEILGKKDVGLVKKLNVNGLKFDTNLAPVEAENGDILVPFDLTLGLEYKLDSYVEWDKKSKTLTVNGNGTSVSFTVGSDTYVANGKTEKLPYVIPEIDGLPAIPFGVLAEALNYEYSYTEKDGVRIDVPEFKGMYDSVSDTAWEFNVPGYLGGWNSSNTALSVHPDGYLVLSNKEKGGTDPMMFTAFTEPFVAKKYKAVTIRVRYEHSESKTNWIQLFFATELSGSWSEDKSVKFFLGDSYSTGDEWREFTVDLSALEAWNGRITKLRFDPFNSVGEMHLDYIRFVEDPDYVETEEDKVEETTGPITLVNGDFEGEGGFTSPGNYSIVEDAENPGNHMLKVMPKNDEKIWLYAWQKVRFTPGTTYRLSFDHKLASIGTNEEDIPKDTKAVIICNIQYSDTANSPKDHLVKQVYLTKNLTHTEITFTVDENSDIRSDDRIGIYTNPMGDTGVGFYLDNVTITEVEFEEE